MSDKQYKRIIKRLDSIRVYQREVRELKDTIDDMTNTNRRATKFGNLAVAMLAEEMNVTEDKAVEAVYQAWREREKGGEAS